MRGTVAGVGATGRVFWSVGAIESEVDSYGFGSGVLVGWQIRFVPLEPGPNVIIITVFDSAGQSASTTLTVVREAVGGVLYVDCSSPDAGDGSRGSPLNRLQHAV
ncbi:MAG TPA: hypothetical protein VFP98_02825, partial [Candidatus Polarisedimenticolia bacterium]|nr:hypothetical protein [Candidatus Polarisedimenticolia bacterium]